GSPPEPGCLQTSQALALQVLSQCITRRLGPLSRCGPTFAIDWRPIHMVSLRGTLLGSALIGLLGCAGPNHVAGDPLLGKPAAAAPAAPAASPTAAIPLVSAPAPPSPNGNASTAALASSTAASPDGSYPLRIGGGTPGDGRTWSGPNASTASLQRPEPPCDPVAHGDPQPPPLASPQTPSPTTAVTFGQAQAQVQTKGLSWH